jgi:hypothetical protein
MIAHCSTINARVWLRNSLLPSNRPLHLQLTNQLLYLRLCPNQVPIKSLTEVCPRLYCAEFNRHEHAHGCLGPGSLVWSCGVRQGAARGGVRNVAALSLLGHAIGWRHRCLVRLHISSALRARTNYARRFACSFPPVVHWWPGILSQVRYFHDMDAVLAAAAWNGHTKVRWACTPFHAAVVNETPCQHHARKRPHLSSILIYVIFRHRLPWPRWSCPSPCRVWPVRQSVGFVFGPQTRITQWYGKRQPLLTNSWWTCC